MTEFFELTVEFIDGTTLEVSDVNDTHENLVGMFLRVEAGESRWVLFFDKIKYLTWTPQS